MDTKLLFSIISATLLAGCVATTVKPVSRMSPAKSTRPVVSLERQQAIARGDFNSLLVAYKIAHGRQRDDSIHITKSALKKITPMVVCPPLEDQSGLRPYYASIFIDEEDLTVKISVNRPYCSIDSDKVKTVLDESIAQNIRDQNYRFEQEKNARESNPQGPYQMGCEDYQRFVRGGKNMPDVTAAQKMYPKVDSLYARRLYVTGWEDARLYGVRKLDCNYLAKTNIQR